MTKAASTVALTAALLLALISAPVTEAVTSNVDTFVQLFEWSWADVAAECESYLAPKGFWGVQISPPMEHITGSQWWTRYQPVSYQLVSRSGSEEDFKSMVSRCNAANVSIVVDAVINHMAAGSGKGTAGSTYGSRSYPIYSPNDFHHYDGNVMSNCEVDDYTDKYNVQYCDLVGLPDLSTGSSYVQQQLSAYIAALRSYGVAGVRVDAAKHQDAGELSGILGSLPAGFYVVQEVIGAAGEAVQPSDYFSLGQVTEFFYADYLDNNIIPQGKMQYLKSFGESWGLMPTQYALAFLDNHDTQRNGRAQLTYKDGALYAFASVFMLSWDYGKTRVMSSYYFSNDDQGPPAVGVQGGSNCHDGVNWVCEHRWPAIGNMVNWRNAAGTGSVDNWSTGNTNQIAFSRKDSAFIALNRDEGSSWSTGERQTGLPAGVYCNVIVSDDSGSCSDTVTVSSSGVATMTVPPLSAVAIHVNARKL